MDSGRDSRVESVLSIIIPFGGFNIVGENIWMSPSNSAELKVSYKSQFNWRTTNIKIYSELEQNIGRDILIINRYRLPLSTLRARKDNSLFLNAIF